MIPVDNDLSWGHTGRGAPNNELLIVLLFGLFSVQGLGFRVEASSREIELLICAVV